MLQTVTAALDRAGDKITRIVGTMWMAIAFTGIALVSLPAALHTGDPIIIVAWIAQTLFQLVLLPVIMVGQNRQAAAAEERGAQHAAEAEERANKHAAETEARDVETHATVMQDHADIKTLLISLHTKVDQS